MQGSGAGSSEGVDAAVYQGVYGPWTVEASDVREVCAFLFFFFFWYLFVVVGCGLLLFELLFNFVFLYDLLFLLLCSMLFLDVWMVEVILKVCLLVVL